MALRVVRSGCSIHAASSRCCVRAASSSSNLPEIPVIDVASIVQPSLLGTEEGERRGRELTQAAAEVGLFYITNHGVDEAVLRRARDYSRSFFALPLQRKDEISIRDSPSRRGYQRIGDNVTEGRRDQHEAVDFYRNLPLRGMEILKMHQQQRVWAGHATNFGTNQWPREGEELALRGFQEFFENEYVPSMLHLGGSLMRGLAVGMELPSSAFDRFFDKSFWVMRLIQYPPQQQQQQQQQQLRGNEGGLAEEKEEALGCGRHTDYGCLTIVNQDPNPVHAECLEALLLPPQQTNPADAAASEKEDEEEGGEGGGGGGGGEGIWVPVPPVPGALAVNIGDMLEVWTKRRRIPRLLPTAGSQSPRSVYGGTKIQKVYGGLRATPHRVHPPRAAEDRISVPFFFEPNYDAWIAPLPPSGDGSEAGKVLEADMEAEADKGVRYGDHLLRKVATNFPELSNSNSPDFPNF